MMPVNVQTPVKTIQMFFNNTTYYKPGSLGSGHGSSVNSRVKSKRT